MAASVKANVIIFDDTGGSFPYVVSIQGILWTGGTTATASIAASDGTVIWSAGTSRVFDDVFIRDQSGVTVTLTGTGGILYLYGEKKG